MLDPVSTPALVLIVAIVMGLMELLKITVSAIVKSSMEKKIDEMYIHSRELHDMHNKFDADGTPLWYVPRSWSTTQTEILKTVNTISNTQEKLGDTIVRIAIVLDKIEDKVDRYDD